MSDNSKNKKVMDELERYIISNNYGNERDKCYYRQNVSQLEENVFAVTVVAIKQISFPIK